MRAHTAIIEKEDIHSFSWGGRDTARLIGLLIVLISFLVGARNLYGQTTESRLSWLESVAPGERQGRLAEAARAEGEVVAYANMDVAAAKALEDGFMKKYPSVKAHVVHFSGAAIITRVESEARAGKALSDVIDTGQIGMLALVDRKVMAHYRSPQRQFYREEFKDKEGYWTAYMTNVMVTAHNTNLVKKDEAPRKLEDLLKPRWKGKLAMDSQSYVWFGAVLQSMGEEAGVRFMRKLNEQDLKHIRGRRLMSQLVAAGEFDMAIETNLNSVFSLARQGAPLWFAPIQPLFFSPSMFFLSQHALHPHAGALFIDFILSEEGQRIVASTDRMPTNSNVKSGESQLLEGLEIRMPDVLDIGRRYNAIGRQYREIFPGAR